MEASCGGVDADAGLAVEAENSLAWQGRFRKLEGVSSVVGR